MKIRLYINYFDGTGPVWSTDHGDVATEKHWDGVQFRRPGRTVEDLSKRGSKTEPCYWLEFSGLLNELKVPGGKYAVIE